MHKDGLTVKVAGRRHSAGRVRIACGCTRLEDLAEGGAFRYSAGDVPDYLPQAGHEHSTGKGVNLEFIGALGQVQIIRSFAKKALRRAPRWNA